MNQQARQLGEYIRSTRKAQCMSIRMLAAQAGIDSGGLARLECGKVATPQPSTLRSLALALNISLADLFARTGYVVPGDLPDVDTYLRLKYQSLPEEAVNAVLDEVKRIVEQHAVDTTPTSD